MGHWRRPSPGTYTSPATSTLEPTRFASQSINVVNYPAATGVTLTPSPGTTVVVGNSILFTAAGSGSTTTDAAAAPASAYQYQFYLWNGQLPNNNWSMIQDYGVGSTWTLPSSTPAGTYAVAVDVRTISNSVAWDTYTYIYPITVTPSGGIYIGDAEEQGRSGSRKLRSTRVPPPLHPEDASRWHELLRYKHKLIQK